MSCGVARVTPPDQRLAEYVIWTRCLISAYPVLDNYQLPDLRWSDAEIKMIELFSVPADVLFPSSAAFLPPSFYFAPLNRL